MPNHLLFEEDGALKAATILSSADASFQVELPSGKRSKIKAANVLLRFDQPGPAQLMEQAQAQAATIEVDFLWECAPQEEFAFDTLARDYQGRTPTAVESAAILLRLQAAPVYFQRKGRGRFRPAQPDVLKAALAAVERKRRQEQLKQQIVADLKAGALPAAIAALGINLIVRPDKNGIEFKALEQAAVELQTTPLKLLLARGAIASTYRWHLDSFLTTTFPRGTGFASDLPAPVDAAAAVDVPLAAVAAFSIDDSSTTEIDDAFSVRSLGDGRVRIGIHIAAPGAAIERDDPVDAVARARMSTVYAPGMKITMLPPAWIDAFSLNAGRTVQVLSLYADADLGSGALTVQDTVLEKVRIDANLRHDVLDATITAERLQAAVADPSATATLLPVPHAADLVVLWQVAQALLKRREAVRGRPEPIGRIDYGVGLDGDAGGDGSGVRVLITQRPRGAPLDLIVAELMILANSHWGGWLAEQRRVGIYRSQARVAGVSRVKMSTTPAAHEGIGAAHYAWSTSPLRRYVDLVNQRQLIAAARAAAAPYAPNDADLFAVISGFDAAYAAYAEFQERLERFWCLRWIAQEGLRRIAATVLKGDVVRLDGMPLVTRVPGLPELPRGQRVEFDIVGADEIELSLALRLHQVINTPAATETTDDDVDDVVPESTQPESAQPEAGAVDGGAAVAAGGSDAAAADTVVQPITSGVGPGVPQAG